MRKVSFDFSEAPTSADAEALAPWACAIIEAEGGWHAFESATDAEIWEGQGTTEKTIVKFLVVSYRKPERERVSFNDHGAEFDFFESLTDAVLAIQNFHRLGLYPEGDTWAVSGLDDDDCCLEVFEVDTEEEGSE